MITQDQARKLFTYKNGFLINKETRSPRAISGNTAGSFYRDGYSRVQVYGSRYLLHRLIFLYHHGFIPKYVDHIDRNAANNKIENLRECSISQNTMNAKIRSNNTSGFKGVTWCINNRLWIARICANKKHFELGKFWDKETAAQVVKIERIKLHGEFANHG